MWLIRSGKNGIYFDKIRASNRIFLPWNGYNFDLKNVKERNEYWDIVKTETQIEKKATIASWASQLYSFVEVIHINDLLMIPSKKSQTYILAQVIGEYKYDSSDSDGLYHSRSIKILYDNIPRGIFSKHVWYSLGTYRTLFRLKEEEEILKTIKSWIAIKL